METNTAIMQDTQRFSGALAHPAAPPARLRAGAAWRLALLLAASLALSACSFLNTSSIDAPSKSRPPANKIVETAKSQLGKPYRNAGDSPQTGFDCSGLVQWTFAQNGIGLPRKSTDQFQVGKRVTGRTDLNPGDLLFFQLNPKRRGGLHVGIYSGGGEFIHSPSTGGKVRAERLSDPYWASTYLGAKRVTE